jgi:hypothetical protein
LNHIGTVENNTRLTGRAGIFTKLYGFLCVLYSIVVQNNINGRHCDNLKMDLVADIEPTEAQ